MEMTLIPKGSAPLIETRGAPVEAVLVEAIETIRGIMGRAAEGDDPFTLHDSLVELSFAVSRRRDDLARHRHRAER